MLGWRPRQYLPSQMLSPLPLGINLDAVYALAKSAASGQAGSSDYFGVTSVTGRSQWASRISKRRRSSRL
jgi:hypothetical protein